MSGRRSYPWQNGERSHAAMAAETVGSLLVLQSRFRFRSCFSPVRTAPPLAPRGTAGFGEAADGSVQFTNMFMLFFCRVGDLCHYWHNFLEKSQPGRKSVTTLVTLISRMPDTGLSSSQLLLFIISRLTYKSATFCSSPAVTRLP